MYLYFRMFLIMGISFYTTRVVLDYLGVDDYGIYNVVGGMVSMFAVLSAALTSAISRFLTYEIGRDDKEKLNETFSAALTILVLLAIVFIIVMEPAGIWFLNNKMEIAPERLGAAHWVLQCSVVTFCINLISIPYNALIVAHERMQAFAYISLLEAVLKLCVAFLLAIPIFDSLKLYAVLVTAVALLIRYVYGSYSARHFDETHVKLSINPAKFKEILSFTGWTCIGGSASILNNQGVNVLLNLFWGTAVNAARGIAMQVNTAVTSFSTNFMMAVNPQIIKSYASENRDRTEFLVFQSARMAFFLMLLIATPIFVETEPIISLWLKDVPDYTIIFIQIVLVQSLVDSMCLPLQTLNQASGKVKLYQIIAGGVLLLNFPLSYLVLEMNCSPESVFIVALSISVLGLMARLSVLKHQIGLRSGKFFLSVFLKGIVVGALCVLPPMYAAQYISDTIINMIIAILVSVLWSGLTIFSLGLNSAERNLLMCKISGLYHRCVGK